MRFWSHRTPYAGWAERAANLTGVTESPVPAVPPAPDRMRWVAGVVCLLQALALLGFCLFYLWELTQGASDDPTRVVMSVVLIAVFGVALGWLGRAWLRGVNWANTPTVVWNLLLLPVAWGLVQGGRAPLGVLVGVVAVIAIVAALGANTSDEPPADAAV